MVVITQNVSLQVSLLIYVQDQGKIYIFFANVHFYNLTYECYKISGERDITGAMLLPEKLYL